MNDEKTLKLEAERATKELQVAQQNLSTIDGKLAAARQVLEGAEVKRNEIAFKFGIGDKDAVAAKTKIDRDVAGAESELKTLQIARAEALKKIAEAESADRNARFAVETIEWEAKARKLIEIDTVIDRSVASLEQAVRERDGLCELLAEGYLTRIRLKSPGTEITITNIQSVAGYDRLLAAMPLWLLRKLFPGAILPTHQVKLAAADSAHFNVNPNRGNDAAAA